MKASIIIPTFNRNQLLKNCINSWLNQSVNRDEYEIIVIDNNSTDKTELMFEENFANSKNIKYIKEYRKGLVYARHAGLANAVSEILIFADDDATYNEICVEEILKAYNINSNAVAIGGKIDIQWDKKPPEWILNYEGLLGKIDYGNEIIFSNKIFINGGLFSIKKSKLIELGGFNPDQIGEYLVGDGESGLCKKIHKKELIIGWTPFAIMKHIQFVDKNGTQKDIKRRFFNNGVCESYALFRENNFEINKALIKNVLIKFKKWLKLEVKSKIRSTEIELKFKASNIKGQLHFYFLLLKKEFRKEIAKENWF